MQLSTGHVLTTHAGSLPRHDDLAQMLFAVLDGKPVDRSALDERVRTAIAAWWRVSARSANKFLRYDKGAGS
jgi:hypothetical protein